MANNTKIYGAIVANKYQCPTNMIKPKKCTQCGDVPVCQDVLPIADITGPVIGFKHSEYVEDPGCLAPVDGIVRFNKPVVVTAEGGLRALYNATCDALMGYDVPKEDQANPDICTVVLECDIMLEVTEEEVRHTGQTSLISYVLEDGTEVPFTRLCTTSTECKYQNISQEEITEAAVLAAVPNAKDIVIEPIVNGEVTVYQYTFTLADEDLPADASIGGSTPALCGPCECVYVEAPAAETEEAPAEVQAQVQSKAKKSNKKGK